MPGKILGIDITEQYISATQVMSGLKGYQVISCFSIPVTDNNLEKALGGLSEKIDFKTDKCHLSVSPALISFRNIKTPFRDHKKIRQTLPFEMETHVPFAVDDMIIDYTQTGEGDRTALLTAAINKVHIADYLEKLKAAGFEPDIIDIRPVPAVRWITEHPANPETGLYLDLEPEQQCAVLFKNRRIVLIRKLEYSLGEKAGGIGPDKNEYFSPEAVAKLLDALCIETGRTIHSYKSNEDNEFKIEKIFFGGRLSGYSGASSLIGTYFGTDAERAVISGNDRCRMEPGISRSYEPALMDNALAVSVRENKKGTGFNLRRGEFQLKKSLLGPVKQAKVPILLACLLFILFFISMGVDYYFISSKHAVIEDRFNREFDKKFPKHRTTKGINYRFLLIKQNAEKSEKDTDKVSGTIPDYRILDLMMDISERVDKKYAFDIKTMIVDANTKEIKLSVNTDSFDTVDKIKNALSPSELFTNVKVKNPAQTDDGASFELRMERTD